MQKSASIQPKTRPPKCVTSTKVILIEMTTIGFFNYCPAYSCPHLALHPQRICSSQRKIRFICDMFFKQTQPRVSSVQRHSSRKGCQGGGDCIDEGKEVLVQQAVSQHLHPLFQQTQVEAIASSHPSDAHMSPFRFMSLLLMSTFQL